MRKLLFLLTLLCSLTYSGQAQERFSVDPSQLQKLQMAEVAIANLYVDSVDQKKLVEDAIVGMISKLDPHSSYSNPKDTKKLTEPLEGGFEGIGVQFNMLQDSLIVLQTVPKGPSEKMGIMIGDRIVKVDNRVIAGVKMDRDTIMSLLRGPKGTKVLLTIIRPGATEPLKFLIVRDKIPVNTLDAKYMIAPGIGYVHLDNFGAPTNDELAAAIKELKAKGMKKLILDLQMNGGGYLGAASDIASQFLKEGQLIVYTEGRTSDRNTYNAKGGGLFTSGKLVILVDEFTASAAEIVSGAIQDHDRGLIVGRRTFGKGLVQRPFPLPDGSMIRLTTAHYYTPSGRCIQKPYTKGDKKDYDMDFLNRYNHGELTCIDSIHLDSTKVYHTTAGKTVYGGGGIMPDVFVPIDTTRYTKYYTALNRQNILRDQTLKFVDAHRKELKAQFKSFDEFDKKYEVPQSLIDTVVSLGKKAKITAKDDAEMAKTLPDLRFMLKGLMIIDLWDRSEYSQYVNRQNPIVVKALEIMQAK